MQDCFKRDIDYLRVSLTSNCNLRCQYCMPEKGIKPQKHLLTQLELVHLVKLICVTGIKKIRLTGGEPLLYTGIEELITKFKNLPNIEKVVLTTNGILLAPQALKLAQSGLDGINLSLDCLDKNLFKQITRGGDIQKVILGIEEAISQKIPLKLNSVIMQGVNEQEVIPLIDFANKYGIDLRFIELMPMNVARQFTAISEEFLKQLIIKRYGKMQEVGVLKGPARYYTVNDLDIKIGFISAISHRFCANCNRLRLTSTGVLKPCLHYDSGVNLATLLKNNVTDEELLTIIKDIIYHKPQRHHLEDESFPQKENKSMSLIGG